MHRAIDPILDEVDPIEGFYYLEVSSPGVERELRTDEHILLSVGVKVEAKLFAAKDGRKSIVGVLKSYEDGVVVIAEESGEVSLSKADISRLTTVFFDEE